MRIPKYFKDWSQFLEMSQKPQEKNGAHSPSKQGSGDKDSKNGQGQKSNGMVLKTEAIQAEAKKSAAIISQKVNLVTEEESYKDYGLTKFELAKRVHEV